MPSPGTSSDKAMFKSPAAKQESRRQSSKTGKEDVQGGPRLAPSRGRKAGSESPPPTGRGQRDQPSPPPQQGVRAKQFWGAQLSIQCHLGPGRAHWAGVWDPQRLTRPAGKSPAPFPDSAAITVPFLGPQWGCLYCLVTAPLPLPWAQSLYSLVATRARS